MIDLATTLSLHERLIDKYGGSKGLRDKGSLLAALARPYATFDQRELYPTPSEKAAAIFESIIINHPFIDGNKRIAYFLMVIMLNESDFYIDATQDERYAMTISASKGDFRFEEIKQWLMARIKNNDK
ncbi:MAG: type II toxin-antitoxin system death-on-curing family toxin [Mucilaginibacter sp.]